MLEVARIQENRTEVETGLKKRGFTNNDLQVLDKILHEDHMRRQTQTELDALNAKVNQASKQIGQLYREGNREAAEEIKSDIARFKEHIKSLEESARDIRTRLDNYLINLPNIPHTLVPAGASEEDNEVYIAHQGDLPILSGAALPHWELAEKFNLIDFKIGAKITGSGFPLYRGKGAKLERALINYFLDKATQAGYEEILPPLMVNEASARGTGQIPDKEGQMYHIQGDDLYMIPTAEVPITNVYRDEILKASDLPLRMTGHTPCFRREAGSYGADVKGLNRVHQFNKVEIVQIVHPEKSYDVLDEMIGHVAALVKSLKLPYRVLRLCGGDLGFAAALTYDFEVYSAAQQKWLEVSSVSNFESFQSNRLNLRFREEGVKRPRYVHTLNGSALALARIVAAILENNQTADRIEIPEVLRSYTGFDFID